jgi:hypothetical protein
MFILLNSSLLALSLEYPFFLSPPSQIKRFSLDIAHTLKLTFLNPTLYLSHRIITSYNSTCRSMNYNILLLLIVTSYSKMLSSILETSKLTKALKRPLCPIVEETKNFKAQFIFWVFRIFKNR